MNEPPEISEFPEPELSVPQRIGCVLLFIVVGLIMRQSAATAAAIIMIVALILIFYRQIRWHWEQPAWTTIVETHLPDHAYAAASRAGLPLNANGYLPRDLGFVVYENGVQQPKLHRDSPIPMTAAYLQPFVEFDFGLPVKNTVHFMLIDHSGTTRFHSEFPFTAQAGRRVILPLARMPVPMIADPSSDWTLVITLGSVKVAEHPLNWYDPAGDGIFSEHIGADGELTADLAELVKQAALNPMSLDDLLGNDSRGDVR